MKRLALLITIILGGAICALALPKVPPREPDKSRADAVLRELSAATNPRDSLTAIVNYFDLAQPASGIEGYDSICETSVQLALRIHDYETGLDMLRNTANKALASDTVLTRCLERTAMFPESSSRRETEAFIRAIKALHIAKYTDDATSKAELQRLIKEYSTNPPSDIYDRVVMLFSLIFHMGEVMPGELMVTYTDRLGDEIRQLPQDDYALKNLYLVHASIIYSSNDEHRKAVEMDRELLDNIDALEQGYMGRARRYRDYSASRYLVYSRMLANYRDLSPEMIETAYRKVNELAAKDFRSYSNYKNSRKADIFYLMANKRYSEALPLLKEYIDKPLNAYYRRYLLREMIIAANEVGDKEAVLYASQAYNKILEKLLDERMSEKVKELETVYAIAELKMQHQKREMALHRRLLIISLCAAGLLLVLLSVLLVMYRRRVVVSKSLRRSNDQLVAHGVTLRKARDEVARSRDEAQRANRIKSDFIKNMSSEIAAPLHIIDEYTNLIVDCADASERPYLHQFSDLITYNADLLRTIVSDLLNLSQIDSNTLEVSIRKTELLPLCNKAVDSLKYRVKRNVTISVAQDLPKVSIDTDPHRLSQILFQLLINAAKFTDSGSIKLFYEVLPIENKVEIFVRDTGRGVPEEDRERIFERFVKLDSSVQGAGVGLPLARLLATRLGGTLELRESSEYGSLFCLTLPLVKQ
ncbi:MAG: HAMP domain-containing histidine kinase [Candidatus Amulumruptor caecigallinarius]|nr:HAMP domain-containing histidine kinase [Candidatus Amulumruptor caecigallinarius]MCM1396155.1 HAMP domain-containing histidine kinase [Candidatus Amulumruptor caecigallinarius]MCM1453845.1 HAMP domain-containing histidine kinase [bacterium]